MKSSERWSLYTHQLPPLRVRDHVRIQNQTGSYPTKWDKTGQIVEVRQFHQYVIRMDGSRFDSRTQKTSKTSKRFIFDVIFFVTVSFFTSIMVNNTHTQHISDCCLTPPAFEKHNDGVSLFSLSDNDNDNIGLYYS